MVGLKAAQLVVLMAVQSVVAMVDLMVAQLGSKLAEMVLPLAALTAGMTAD